MEVLRRNEEGNYIIKATEDELFSLIESDRFRAGEVSGWNNCLQVVSLNLENEINSYRTYWRFVDKYICIAMRKITKSVIERIAKK